MIIYEFESSKGMTRINQRRDAK